MNNLSQSTIENHTIPQYNPYLYNITPNYNVQPINQGTHVNMFSNEMMNNALYQMLMQMAMITNSSQIPIQSPETTSPASTSTISFSPSNTKKINNQEEKEKEKEKDEYSSLVEKKEKGFSYLKINRGYLKINFLKFPIKIIMAAKVEYKFFDTDGNEKKHYMLVPAKDFYESDEFCLEQTFHRIEENIEKIIFYPSSFVSIRSCIAYEHHENFNDMNYNYFGELSFSNEKTVGKVKTLRGEIPSTQAYTYDIGKEKYKSIYLGTPYTSKGEAYNLEKIFSNMIVKFRFYIKSEKKPIG